MPKTTPPPAPITPDDDGIYFVTVAVAAKRLGVGRSAGYELIHRGILRSTQVGARRLVPVSAIAEAAERIMAGAAAGPTARQR